MVVAGRMLDLITDNSSVGVDDGSVELTPEE